MTCVVAIKGNKEIVVASDSAGITDYDVISRKDPKVIKIGKFCIGFAGSFRMGQIVMCDLRPPAKKPGMKDYNYMVTQFVPSLIKLFKKHHFDGVDKKNRQELGGSFIVAYNGEIYLIDDDYQVGMSNDDFMSIGCGSELAMGALHALSQTSRMIKEEPKHSALVSLEAAEKYSAGVVGPFNMVSISRGGGRNEF